MKKWAVLFSVVPLLFLFTVVSPARAELGGFTGNANLLIGGKFLNDDWMPTENHLEFGVQFDVKKEGWPVSIAVEYLRSSAEETIVPFDFEMTAWELNLGVRKVFDQYGNMHPYVGGGLSIIGAELEIVGFGTADDSGVGIWLGGGVYWTLSEHFNVGGELKYSFADVFGSNAGGIHIGGLVGYHF